jgi:hypothetical protein
MTFVAEMGRRARPKDGHPKVFTMLDLDSYLDESGIHDGAKVCIIAGFFGEERAWSKAEKLWKKRLAQFGVPLDEFHSKDLVKCHGFFGRWTPTKSLKLQLALAEVIAKHGIFPIAQGVTVDDFFKFSINERRFMTGATLYPNGRLKETGNPSRPYFAAFQPLMNQVLRYAPPRGKVHFYCGLDRPFAAFAGQLYGMLKTRPGHQYQNRFGDISFPMAKETPALQAADLLSHLTYLDMLERVTGEHWTGEPSDIVKVLLTNIRDPKDVCYQNERCMRETLGLIPPEYRPELLAEDLAV